MNNYVIRWSPSVEKDVKKDGVVVIIVNSNTMHYITYNGCNEITPCLYNDFMELLGETLKNSVSHVTIHKSNTIQETLEVLKELLTEFGITYDIEL